jgi:hypothetical protein
MNILNDDSNSIQDMYLRDQKIMNENKHTDTDMMEFAEWTSENRWIFIKTDNRWIKPNMTLRGFKTTAHLLQEFKDWKEANNG